MTTDPTGPMTPGLDIDPDRPWYRPLRQVVKTTTTVALMPGLAEVPVRRDDGDGFGHAAPRLAEIVMSSVHGGAATVVHGVTAVTDLGGRYFRRRHADGSWPDDTPQWVAFLAAMAERGALPAPVQRCEVCGYAVQPDGRGGWQHSASMISDPGHRTKPVGAFT